MQRQGPTRLAWIPSIPVRLQDSRRAPQASPCTRRSSRRCRPPRCSLTPDEESAALGAARATYHLATDSPSSASTHDLHLFCAVKGVTAGGNPWDRARLLAAAAGYAEDERAVRLRSGARWERLDERGRVRLCHTVCNAEGDVTYIDPATGYTVFSFFGHLKRGSCCGIKTLEDGAWERTHRCRHCPYTDDGRLVSEKTVALKARIGVVERSRERAQEIWKGGLSGEGTGGAQAGGDGDGEDGAAVSGKRETVVPREQLSLDGSHLRRVVRIKPRRTSADAKCAVCGDEGVVRCTRCNGWTYLFSPQLMECPQCSAEGYHPCMACTPFRPPSRSSFYS